MTTFKEIRGKLIRTLDTDPTPATNYEGEIWYNKTIGVLKSAELVAAAWSAGGNVNSKRSSLGGAGTQTAAVIMGGVIEDPAPETNTAATEEYDGSTWTSVNNLASARAYSHGGAGTQTAAIYSGGAPGSPFSPSTATTTTQLYDGTNWTSGPNMNTSRLFNRSAGLQTATVTFGGRTGAPAPGTSITDSEEYNGTAWTSGNPLITANKSTSGTGTQTAAISLGGQDSTSTQSYDGTSWSALPTSSPQATTASSDAGTQTAALKAGGNFTPTNPLVSTELWDGTSYTNSANLSTGRYSTSGGGGVAPQSAAWVGSGGNPVGPGNATNATEEFTGAFIGTKTLTTS